MLENNLLYLDEYIVKVRFMSREIKKTSLLGWNGLIWRHLGVFISGVISLLFLWAVTIVTYPTWVVNESFLMGLHTSIISGVVVYVMITVSEKQRLNTKK